MYIAATKSSLDIAYWFFDKAQKTGEYLEADKLQHMLFLSQAYFSVAYDEEQLMPSVFVTTEDGFAEPQLVKIFANGRPYMQSEKLADRVDEFLTDIWTKYGRFTSKELSETIKQTEIYKTAISNGNNSIIDYLRIIEYYKKDEKKASSSLDTKKILFTQTGKPVTVTKWQPKRM